MRGTAAGQSQERRSKKQTPVQRLMRPSLSLTHTSILSVVGHHDSRVPVKNIQVFMPHVLRRRPRADSGQRLTRVKGVSDDDGHASKRQAASLAQEQRACLCLHREQRRRRRCCSRCSALTFDQRLLPTPAPLASCARLRRCCRQLLQRRPASKTRVHA